jgi:hypothetical protein
MHRATLPIAFLVALATACGESAEKSVNVVQAASKSAVETIQHAVESLDLSQMTPDAAKAKVQQLLDRAGAALAEAKDSEMVQQAIAVLDALLDRLAQLRQSAATKIDVHGLQTSVQEQIQRFRDDPRVQTALKTLQEKVSRFAR